VRRIGIGANSNGIRLNGVDETSRANGSRWGGIQSYWTGEAQLKTASQPKFKRIGMELDKLTGLCYATDELLQDSTALDSWLRQAFTDEFTFKVEDAIINGTGAGMPLGFLNSGAVITVSKEGSQGAATIVAENILKMWARMPARSRKNAVWLSNQDVEPQLYQFVIKVKNVAGTENVGGIAAPVIMYTPPGQNGNQYATLMGRPVIPVEYAATLGTAGDIALVDLSQYLLIDKGPTEFASSIHVRFIYDETAFRFVYRANGQPIWQVPMTPYKGTATQSPFIVLQTR
jgi:HK97 family phage major capsid protein